MDPLHFCIAITPLSVYLLMLAYLNLRGRPFVTTGARDAGALAIGVCGLMIAGPMELFFPQGAASQFGAWVWLLLIVFYGLCISLLVLLMRTRIVIYNMTFEQLRPILSSISLRLDPNSRWAGDSLLIPDLSVHLHVESVAWLKNIQLTAGGNQQSYEGWQLLEKELVKSVGKIKVAPNLIGVGMLVISGVLAAGTSIWMLNDKLAVAQAFNEMLLR